MTLRNRLRAYLTAVMDGTREDRCATPPPGYTLFARRLNEARDYLGKPTLTEDALRAAWSDLHDVTRHAWAEREANDGPQ